MAELEQRLKTVLGDAQVQLGSTELDPVSGFVDTVKYITEDLNDYAIIVPYGSGVR